MNKKNILISVLGIVLFTSGLWVWSELNKPEESPVVQDVRDDAEDLEEPAKPAPRMSFVAVPTDSLIAEVSARLAVEESYSGNALVFFGDGTSVKVPRLDPTLFDGEWSHTYPEKGTYPVTLVLTSEPNVTLESDVMKGVVHPSNTVVKEVFVTVPR